MPKHVPPEDLLIPPQDNRICGTICVCQMTAVLSSVALVYLSVAVYMPSMRAFKSGFDETPVMCTTTKTLTQGAELCDWGTCGEWCLSKSGGGGGPSCVQVFVTLRRNGSHLIFQNCSSAATKTCFGIDAESARKMRCIADECRNLTGTFNCTQGMCINITDAFECVFLRRPQPVALPEGGGEGGTGMAPPVFPEEELPSKCSGRRGKITCIALDGLQQCVRGTCTKIRPPYNCDRRCVDIPTRNKNVILLSGDRVYLSRCTTAVLAEPEPKEEDEEDEEEVSEEKDAEKEEEKDEEEDEESDEPPPIPHGRVVWRSSKNPDDILLVSCHTVVNTTRGVEATDCINGSLLERSRLADLTNFTHLTHLSAFYDRPLDEGDDTDRMPVAPPEARLVIANESKLQINLEGCVNTLRDECREFLKEFGRDGTDHNARARFPCFFSPREAGQDSEKGGTMTTAVARFDLAATYREFMVAALLPSVLFVVSCFTLLLCQRTVNVGDDARMRFTGCANILRGSDKGGKNGAPPLEEVNVGGDSKCSPGEMVAVDMGEAGKKGKTVEEEEEEEEEDRANGDGGGGGTGRPF